MFSIGSSKGAGFGKFAIEWYCYLLMLFVIEVLAKLGVSG